MHFGRRLSVLLFVPCLADSKSTIQGRSKLKLMTRMAADP